jgi:hypothetical protein
MVSSGAKTGTHFSCAKGFDKSLIMNHLVSYTFGKMSTCFLSPLKNSIKH